VRRETLFRALGSLLGEPEYVNGRIVVMPSDQIIGVQLVQVTNLSRVEPELAHLPLLHLDATLRPQLAATILPDLEVVHATAAMPHMRLAAVQGSFGKATLIEDPKANPDENQRRRNRLRDCVDHVRWEAARVRPGRTLVVTYKQIEPAFAGIPGVGTGHFKAIAGLDTYKDVALLIVIGRPLPTDRDLGQLTSAHLGHVPNGSYRVVRRGLLMRDGTRRAISVPVIELAHLTEAQKRAYILADNKLAEQAGWDRELLALELGELQDMAVDLASLGFEAGELDALLRSGEADPREEDIPEAPVVPVSRHGDVWLLGNHRLICGDATDAGTVAKVLNGVRPHLMVTDPPFGVNYDPAWRNEVGAAKTRRVGKVTRRCESFWQLSKEQMPRLRSIWKSGNRMANGLSHSAYLFETLTSTRVGANRQTFTALRDQLA
jgi:hypothetical protein